MLQFGNDRRDHAHASSMIQREPSCPVTNSPDLWQGFTSEYHDESDLGRGLYMMLWINWWMRRRVSRIAFTCIDSVDSIELIHIDAWFQFTS